MYKSVAVSIVNVLGQLVQEETFSTTSRISLGINGASGLYIVDVSNEKGEKMSLKVVKE